jgi:tetratricopeptide (TPR) repeat protein
MTQSHGVEQILETAIGRQQAGLLQGAETLYREVLAVDPTNIDALNLLGLVLQDSGYHCDGLDLIGRALEIDPNFAEAFANKARGLNILNRPNEASIAAKRAVELDPDLGEAWQQLGVANLRLHQPEQAREAFRTAQRFLPESVDVQAGLAEAAKLLADHATVAEALINVLAARPDHITTLIDLSIALTAQGRLDEALALQRRALELDPDNNAALIAMALTMFNQRYDLPALEALCRRLLAGDPDNVNILVVLAGTQGWLGQFEEAKASYRRILEIQPDHANARTVLTLLTTDAGMDSDIKGLRERFENADLPILDRVATAFTIGKSLERAGDFDGAFTAYKAANEMNGVALRTAGRGFNRDELRRYVNWNTEAFVDGVFARFQGLGNSSELPVFIVGMPRSGTSLVEQIAASHPEVFGAGERRDIEGIMSRITRGPSLTVPVQWDRAMMRLETSQHIVTLHELGGSARRVIDKLPDNIFFLGQIALLFPNARIIVCRRDLRDVCVSCFANHFTATLNWSTNLEDLGFRAVATECLMNHWRRVVPLRMLEVNYEALVADLETESRRLIDFLGLQWDPACLDFHNTKRAVATVSYMQIRQPIYDSSIGRWRRFATHLGPLLNILEECAADEPAR